MILPELARRAALHVETEARRAHPFFLYLALTSPHHPVLPLPEFQGRSGAGAYGDFVAQTDAAVGHVLEAIDRGGIAPHTLVIFTSDNGPEITREDKGIMPVGAYDRLRRFGHASMGPLRGIKYETWEGGHRIPFLARWPGRIPAAATSDQMLCLTDLVATCAAVAGAGVPENAAEDSFDALPAILGGSGSRDALVVQGVRPGSFAVRRGDWIYLTTPAGHNPEPDWYMRERGYASNAEPDQLYRLSDDLAQRRNLASEHPDKARELRALLDEIRARGRHSP